MGEFLKLKKRELTLLRGALILPPPLPRPEIMFSFFGRYVQYFDQSKAQKFEVGRVVVLKCFSGVRKLVVNQQHGLESISC